MRTLLLLLGLLASGAVQAQGVPVEVELVLAVDISGSVDPVEAEQQRQGYVQALTDPAVLQAIHATPSGRIAVAYVEWAAADTQYLTVPWRVVETPADAQGLAGAIAESPARRARWTSISSAIDFSVPLFDDNGFEGSRRVIDISGDGVNNHGRPLPAARDEALARGIVINGLPILNDRPQPFAMPTPMEIGLDEYYARNVIGGPGSFLVPALGFDAFKDAILQKLILEIAGREPPRRWAGLPQGTAGP